MAKSKKQVARGRKLTEEFSDPDYAEIGLRARPPVNLRHFLPSINSCLWNFRQSYRAGMAPSFNPKTKTITWSELNSEDDLRRRAQILRDAADVYEDMSIQSIETEKLIGVLREDSERFEADARSKRRKKAGRPNGEEIEAVVKVLMLFWREAGGRFDGKHYGPLVSFVSVAMGSVMDGVTKEAAGHWVIKCRKS